jgi:hypothetical protein
MLPEYRNEPLTDFSRPEQQDAFRAALKRVKARIGGTYPLVIGGELIETSDHTPSANPARPQEVLGTFAKATTQHAYRAIEAAAAAFETWKRVPGRSGAVLLRAAAVCDGAARVQRDHGAEAGKLGKRTLTSKRLTFWNTMHGKKYASPKQPCAQSGSNGLHSIGVGWSFPELRLPSPWDDGGGREYRHSQARRTDALDRLRVVPPVLGY